MLCHVFIFMSIYDYEYPCNIRYANSINCITNNDAVIIYNVATGICSNLNPCQNGGTCLSLYNDKSYNCTCAFPYSGKRCEIRKCVAINI